MNVSFFPEKVPISRLTEMGRSKQHSPKHDKSNGDSTADRIRVTRARETTGVFAVTTELWGLTVTQPHHSLANPSPVRATSVKNTSSQT
jgi:hypothetical protein